VLLDEALDPAAAGQFGVEGAEPPDDGERGVHRSNASVSWNDTLVIGGRVVWNLFSN
jgi:hypothetical protein